MTYIAADFGPLILETDVDNAAITTLNRWMTTELITIERERNYAPHLLARPAYTGSFIDDDELLDHRLPAIMVQTDGIQGTPQKFGGGDYSVVYPMTVKVVTRGRTQLETRQVASLYGGAVRRAIVHNPDLGEFASFCRWVDSAIAPVADASDQGRYLASHSNVFHVGVDQVIRENAGPSVPNSPYDDPDPNNPDAPYQPLLPVNSLTVTVEGVPITAIPGDEG
jgi:hypothetical protein